MRIRRENPTLTGFILRVCFGAGCDDLTSTGSTEGDDCLLLKVLENWHSVPSNHEHGDNDGEDGGGGICLVGFTAKAARYPDCVKNRSGYLVPATANASLHCMYACSCRDKLYNHPGYESRHVLYRRYVRHIPCRECHREKHDLIHDPILVKELLKVAFVDEAWNDLRSAVQLSGESQHTSEKDSLSMLVALTEELEPICDEEVTRIENGTFDTGQFVELAAMLRVAQSGRLALAFTMLCGSLYAQISRFGIKDPSLVGRLIPSYICQRSDLRLYGDVWHAGLDRRFFQVCGSLTSSDGETDPYEEADVDDDVHDYGERIVLLRASRSDDTEVLVRKLSRYSRIRRLMRRERVFGYDPTVDDAGIITLRSRASDNFTRLVQEAGVEVWLDGAALNGVFQLVQNSAIVYTGTEALSKLAVGYFGPEGTSWLLNQAAALGKVGLPAGLPNSGAFVNCNVVNGMPPIQAFRGVNMRKCVLIRMPDPQGHGMHYFYKLISGGSLQLEKISFGTLKVKGLYDGDVLGRRVNFTHDIFAV